MNTNQKIPLVTKMNGVTIACPNPREFKDFLIEIFQWELFKQGKITNKLENHWGIDFGSAGKDWYLLRSPKSDLGMIRIIKGIDRERTRPLGTRWSGVEIVVKSGIDELFKKITKNSSFEVLSKPTTFDFSDVGANIHRGFHGKGPGKTHLMFTMEVTKPTAGYDFPSSYAQVGHIFSVPLVAFNYSDSLSFYINEIGMIPVLTDHLEEGLWHKTWKIPNGSPVDISILKGNASGFGLGGIELQGYDNSYVDPIKSKDNLFDGGVCLITYTSDQIELLYKVIESSLYAKKISNLTELDASPYGSNKAFCFRGLSGEKVEVIEKSWN
ncbi:MAG: hypothetical protein CMM49_01060 [Rhodospirillaceae bacterium]|nr:hypothetical protein [Rhodospirillaceae bacterium]